MPRFSPATFRFLDDLAANNRREWFSEHKPRYVSDVQEPALAFVEAMAPRLARLSRHVRADPRPSGGSLFRIHRDTRFSKDKSPYKTHTGIHFRHEQARDAHCPGFYLHVDPAGCFAGVGLWQPDTRTLTRLRQAMVDDPASWKRAFHAKAVRAKWQPGGEALKTAPRGFPKDHPLIEDLRRKDLVLVADLSRRDVTSADLPDTFAALCKAGTPLVRWICETLELPF